MRRRTFTLLACSLGIALVVLAWLMPLEAYDPEQSSSRGPTGYRGCVVSNFHMATPGEEIICDFGSQGVWAFAPADQSWHQLTDQNPAWIFSCRRAGLTIAPYLIASFSSGVWAWNYSGYPGTWTQLTPSLATSGFAVDDDGEGHEEIQLAFANGVWRHDFDTHTWLQYTSSAPSGGLRSAMGTSNVEQGLWSFPGQGLWVFYLSPTVTPIAKQLTTSAAAFDDIVAARFEPVYIADSVIADFAANGTWMSNAALPTPWWSQLTPSAPYALAAIHSGAISASSAISASPMTKPVYNLIFADNAARPWLWSNVGGFVPITSSALDTGFCEPYQAKGLVDTSGRQQAACDFGPQGLWEYDQSGTWKQLTISNPVSMVRGDFFGDLVQETLVVNFGSGVGLWMYDSGGGTRTAQWIKLTPSVPDSGVGW